MTTRGRERNDTLRLRLNHYFSTISHFLKKMKHLTLFVLALFGALIQPAAAQDMTAKNKAAVLAAYDAFNQKDWAGFAALCSTGYTDVNVGPAPAEGINAALDLYRQFHAAFPDFMAKVTDIVPTSPTRFLLRLTVTGTNTGSIMGLPPTGKSIRFEDADVVELDMAGKIISHKVTNSGEPLRQIGYGSFTNPATQVVLDAYQKFGQGDVPGILAICNNDVVFELQDRVFDTKPRWFKGPSEVGGFFQELGTKHQYSKFQPVRFVADGDDVFILVEAEYTQRATGKMYTTTYTHHFRIVNGKISYFRGLDDFQLPR